MNYKITELPVVAGMRTLANVELAEGKTQQAIAIYEEIIASIGEVGIAFSQAIHTDLARAWQRRSTELSTEVSLETPVGLGETQRDSANLNLKNRKNAVLQAQQKATQHAQIARQMSLASRGDQSSDYKTLTALLESLKPPAFK